MVTLVSDIKERASRRVAGKGHRVNRGNLTHDLLQKKRGVKSVGPVYSILKNKFLHVEILAIPILSNFSPNYASKQKIFPVCQPVLLFFKQRFFFKK